MSTLLILLVTVPLGAAIVSFKGTQASYEVLRSKQRVGAIRTVKTK